MNADLKVDRVIVPKETITKGSPEHMAMWDAVQERSLHSQLLDARREKLATRETALSEQERRKIDPEKLYEKDSKDIDIEAKWLQVNSQIGAFNAAKDERWLQDKDGYRGTYHATKSWLLQAEESIMDSNPGQVQQNAISGAVHAMSMHIYEKLGQ
jgi:hypothetical protein